MSFYDFIRQQQGGAGLEEEQRPGNFADFVRQQQEPEEASLPEIDAFEPPPETSLEDITGAAQEQEPLPTPEEEQEQKLQDFEDTVGKEVLVDNFEKVSGELKKGTSTDRILDLLDRDTAKKLEKEQDAAAKQQEVDDKERENRLLAEIKKLQQEVKKTGNKDPKVRAKLDRLVNLATDPRRTSIESEQLLSEAPEGAFGDVFSTLRSAASGLTFGALSPAFAKFEKKVFGERIKPTELGQIASSSAQLLGGVGSVQKLGGAVLKKLGAKGITGLKATLGSSFGTAAVASGLRNLSAIAAEDIGAEEAAGNLAQEIAGTAVGILTPVLGGNNKAINFATQVIGDFAYDLFTDATIRGRLEDQSFRDWFLKTELPQLILSTGLAARDVKDPNFIARRKQMINDLRGITDEDIARIDASESPEEAATTALEIDDQFLKQLELPSRGELGQKVRAEAEKVQPLGRPELAGVSKTEGGRRLEGVVDEARKQAGKPERVTVKELETKAEARIKKQGVQAEKENLLRAARGGAALNAEDTVTAQKIVEREADSVFKTTDDKKWAEAALLVNAYRDVRTEAGRALAVGRDRTLTPAERNKRYVSEALLGLDDKGRKKFNKGTEKVQQRLIEIETRKAQKARDDLKKLGFDLEALTQKDFDNDVRMAEVVRSIQTSKGSVSDKFFEYYLNSILSGPHTQMANVLGNSLNTAWDFTAQRITEALVNTMVRDPNSARLGEFRHMARGMTAGLTKASKIFLRSFDTEKPVFSDQVGREAPGKLTEARERGPKIAGKKGRIVRVPTRFLQAADEFSKSMIFNMQVGAEAYRRGTSQGLKGKKLDAFIQEQVVKTDSDSAVAAIDKAFELTFQEKAGPVGQTVLTLRNKVPAARYFVPFVTTIGNILKTGVRKSPLGSLRLLSRLLRTGSIKVGLNKQDAWVYEKKDMVKDLAEQMLALGATAALSSLVQEDENGKPRLTGTRKKDFGAAQQQHRTSPPTSIRIGDTWYDYSRLEPLGTSLALIADTLIAANQAKTTKEWEQVLRNSYNTVLGVTTEKTFMRGLSDLQKAVEQPHGFERWASNFAAAWVPNLVRQVSSAEDSVIREKGFTFQEEGWWTKLGTRTLQKAVPVAGLAPPPKVDLFGREIKKFEGPKPSTDILWRMIAPVRKQNVRSIENVDRFLLNYNNLNPGSEFYPRPPLRKFKIRKENRVMTDEEYHRFMKRSGELLRRKAVSLRLDADNPSAEGIEKIKRAISKSRRQAKKELFNL